MRRVYEENREVLEARLGEEAGRGWLLGRIRPSNHRLASLLRERLRQ
jgi:hypothetical protein